MDLLVAEHVGKNFSGVRALDDVSASFRKGEVHALLGENGAGKSTLMKIFAGVQPPSEGKLYLDGREVRFGGTADAIAAGICLIYQELSIAPAMTVAQNIFMGQSVGRYGLVNAKLMNHRAQAILDELGAPFSPTDMAGDLSLAEQQQIEIAPKPLSP